jgi:hypothetical protein
MSPNQQFALEMMKWIFYLAIVLSVPATVIGTIAFWRAQRGTAKTFSLLIQRGSIVRLTAIFAIIFCTFILCIIDSLKSDAAASILAGVAGYVLGGATRGAEAPAEPDC